MEPGSLHLAPTTRCMTPGGHTLQILIAEDNEADVFLIKQALEEHGLRYQAKVASDGEQAFAFLHALMRHALWCGNTVKAALKAAC